MHDAFLRVQHPEVCAGQILSLETFIPQSLAGGTSLATADLFLTYLDVSLSENNTFLMM